MELLHGRPENPAGREEREIRVYDLLDALKIDYYRVDHPEARTMEDCAEADKMLGDDTAVCKNLFLCNAKKTEYYLLMMPGDKKFVTRELSHQIGSTRLSFAGEEEMAAFLDIHPGSVSVMGLMNDKENRVQLLIDEEIFRYPWVGCHPCKSTTSLKLTCADLLEIFLPAVHHTPRLVKL